MAKLFTACTRRSHNSYTSTALQKNPQHCHSVSTSRCLKRCIFDIIYNVVVKALRGSFVIIDVFFSYLIVGCSLFWVIFIQAITHNYITKIKCVQPFGKIYLKAIQQQTVKHINKTSKTIEVHFSRSNSKSRIIRIM